MMRVNHGGASKENLIRAQRKLLKNQTARDWLARQLGFDENLVKRYSLGLSEPIKYEGGECRDALSIPVLGIEGGPQKRRLYYAIPGVTSQAKSGRSWSFGAPLVYFSAGIKNKKVLFVCSDVFDVWRLSRLVYGSRYEDRFVFAASTQPESIPAEFIDPLFWSRFEEIYFGHRKDEAGNRDAEYLRKSVFAEVKRVLLPEKFSDWNDFRKKNADIKAFVELTQQSRSMSSEIVPAKLNLQMHALQSDEPEERLGEYAIDPVNCNGAWVNGHLYYPYKIERRELERIAHRDGSFTEKIVTSYRTKVVRSDGAVLDVGYLPAPRGTSPGERVLALSDGTRVEQLPNPNLYATWHLDSVQEFIKCKRNNEAPRHRALGRILADLMRHFRRSVWLPYEEDYAVLALYTAMSYVCNVFEAIPLLMVCGEKGTGKTELGLALEQVSFNGKTVGQGSAAAVIRIVNESRGLVVLDDLEGIRNPSERQSFNEIHQMLKLSYKKKTSKKAVAGKDGKTIMLDFFGPKVITNTGGTDPILSSRTVVVPTRRMPLSLRDNKELVGSDPEFAFGLRNELHTWAMNTAGEVDECYRRLRQKAERDRREEILLPLRALAELSGDKAISENLEFSATRSRADKVVPIDPTQLFREAVEKCVLDGYFKEVALPLIQLQIAALIENDPLLRRSHIRSEWKTSQWIGNAIEKSGIRDKRVGVRRARLYGKETRIYKLNPKFVKSLVGQLSSNEKANLKNSLRAPFDFCEQAMCADCFFLNICEETTPDLRPAKNNRLKRYDFVVAFNR